MSLFAAMNKNSRLRKNMQKAKTTQASREFSGPDGDYPCYFRRFATIEKDGVLMVVFEFRTTDDCGEFSGEKIVIFHRLTDGPIRTAEEEQALLFEEMQLMGVDTSVDDTAIEKSLEALSKSDTVIEVRVKTTQSKKEKNRKFKNSTIIGVAAGEKAVDAASYVPAETSSSLITEESNDWPEDNEEEQEEFVLPSKLIGQTCVYKGKTCVLDKADDTTGDCVVKDPKTGRTVKCKWDDIVWPD